MRILVACEFSGVVREAFRKRGHDAWSCDLEPALDGSSYHICGDVIPLLSDSWDLLIGHPPCTYLSNSGVRWLVRRDTVFGVDGYYPVWSRWEQMVDGARFFMELLNAPVEKICLENPVPHKYAQLPKYTQTIQPWQFGEDASKRTCLWLKGLPRLEPTNVIVKKRYANQTPSGQNKLGPGPERAKLRSITYQGIADAMAEQWG